MWLAKQVHAITGIDVRYSGKCKQKKEVNLVKTAFVTAYAIHPFSLCLMFRFVKSLPCNLCATFFPQETGINLARKGS